MFPDLSNQVTYACTPPSLDGGGAQLMAVVIPARVKHPHGTYFITEPGHPQQVGVLEHKLGWSSPPHYHQSTTRTITGPPCEVLVVQSGVLLVRLFEVSTGQLVHSFTLRQGDVIVLLSGGHSVEALTDVRVLEVKQGPYDRNDKYPLTTT